MSISERRKEFQEILRRRVDAEAIDIEHSERVRQSLARHKYNNPSKTTKRGKEISDGR